MAKAIKLITPLETRKWEMAGDKPLMEPEIQDMVYLSLDHLPKQSAATRYQVSKGHFTVAGVGVTHGNIQNRGEIGHIHLNFKSEY